MAPRVAIVGAGLSGLAAARRLAASGVESVIFEKSRGLGGRMATRRVDGLAFDHGAQFFTARGARFRELVEEWRAAGCAAPWFDDAFVGAPGMSAPAGALASGLVWIGESRACALSRDADGWTVHGADGVFPAPGDGRFAAVLLAVPAPQAAPLAETAGVVFPELARVRYAPCWALMLAYTSPLNLPWDHIRPNDETIAWVARNSSKPGRERQPETLVVHATPEWSRRYLEEPPEFAEAALRERFEALFGVRSAPTLATAHRWRYALVEQPAGVAFVWDEASRIGACGDWALGPRVEAAFDSGEALAEATLTSLGRS